MGGRDSAPMRRAGARSAAATPTAAGLGGKGCRVRARHGNTLRQGDIGASPASHRNRGGAVQQGPAGSLKSSQHAKAESTAPAAQHPQATAANLAPPSQARAMPAAGQSRPQSRSARMTRTSLTKRSYVSNFPVFIRGERGGLPGVRVARLLTLVPSPRDRRPGPVHGLCREPGQGLTAAAISGRDPVPPVSWPSIPGVGFLGARRARFRVARLSILGHERTI